MLQYMFALVAKSSIAGSVWKQIIAFTLGWKRNILFVHSVGKAIVLSRPIPPNTVFSQMPIFVWVRFFRKLISPEGCSKELPQTGYMGGWGGAVWGLGGDSGV